MCPIKNKIDRGYMSALNLSQAIQALEQGCLSVIKTGDDQYAVTLEAGRVLFIKADGEVRTVAQEDIVSKEPAEGGMHVHYLYGPNKVEKYLFATDCIGCFDVDAGDGMQPNP